ncbi:uncharacterized protein SPAPADRAFT_134783 [Spathaspora passalidarum NRRL Y-27907]|uniref:Peptidase S8/S53 domain-containing protein n=1 Tax=Spathaspora passalidarum (strain NRRL Y-27907 / 11-Y1) TaxID=619300 RepID=G3AJ34_SPAPN|nr:uncharacterized protein SPAPADRAFT_134783 [Spathaspora passalidarum NRRL Y-27907]EGW34546.1 hypothetical protein SPAPADRAFT_134783 [Spathaspora passalidarum NRRL Y-27907]
MRVLLTFILICGTFISRSLAHTSYIVALRRNETFNSFRTFDLTFPSSQQVTPLIIKSYSFGKFNAFTGNFTKETVENLKSSPLVWSITPDIILRSFSIQTQEDAPKHLARLSRTKRMRPGKSYPYLYDDQFTGKRVNAYVIDSGVEIGHPQFQGRARTGKDFSNEGPGDQSGHGTHIAGLIGSYTYGSSKGVEMIDVKAINSKGFTTLSSIIAALEFSANHRLRSRRMGVANLSMGAKRNAMINRAVDEAFNTGLVVVAAAGNSNINACLNSPGSSKSAITVSAIDDYNDDIASFSNWGECVDLLASGTYVKSLDRKNIHKANVLSGTSVSAAIVTGLVSNLLSQGAGPNEIKNKLIEMSTKDRIPELSLFLKQKTPNRIAHGIGSIHEDTKDDYDDYTRV